MENSANGGAVMLGVSSGTIVWTGGSVGIVGSFGPLEYWWQPAGSSNWNPQTVATGNFSDYAIAWTGSSMVIIATDVNGNLYYWWQEAGSDTWHAQTVASSNYGANLAWPSIAWTGSSVVIAAAVPSAGGPSPDTGLYYFWEDQLGANVWPMQTVSAWSSENKGYAFPSIAWTGSSVV
ncbi:MAG: hypothetical protein WCC84_16855, partial [Candidatus Cybelea sp.]